MIFSFFFSHLLAMPGHTTDTSVCMTVLFAHQFSRSPIPWIMIIMTFGHWMARLLCHRYLSVMWRFLLLQFRCDIINVQTSLFTFIVSRLNWRSTYVGNTTWRKLLIKWPWYSSLAIRWPMVIIIHGMGDRVINQWRIKEELYMTDL